MKRSFANNNTSPSRKALKTDKSLSSLSPEQKQANEEKRMTIEVKLLAHKLAPKDMGLSWKNALAAEFDKKYFKKLTEFVQSERKSHKIYPKGYPKSQIGDNDQ